MKQVIEEIKEAYCWQGYSAVEQVPSNERNVLEFSVAGQSSIESPGDVSDIHESVADLTKTSIEVDGFKYTFEKVTCDVSHNGPDTVMVSGRVRVNVKPSTRLFFL